MLIEGIIAFGGLGLIAAGLMAVHWWVGRLERIDKERLGRAAAEAPDHPVELTSR